MRILIAGLAGASLGTEIIKCLKDIKKYELYGCDISNQAYGLYSPFLKKAFLADRDDYINSVIAICKENDIQFIIPGGEQPMVLLSQGSQLLTAEGIVVVCNNKKVVELFSDKAATFSFLRSAGIAIPHTADLSDGQVSKLDEFQFPCIVKPSSGTGGSDSVFLANNRDEAVLYVELLKKNKRKVIVQEYIDVVEGEFTIGVLSSPQGNIVSSVVMQRTFNSKLSVSYRGPKGLISSGYSQGLIDDFANLKEQAEKIALASLSTGPLNIQGRVKNGILIPFEINPRFSASTYLRCMAGVNEADLYLKCLAGEFRQEPVAIKRGYYMRSFEETYIPTAELIS
jgi:carbamoyl-phosphate synthase large subunit